MAADAAPRPVAVIGAGLDLGAGRRGVDMGPSAIRYAGLQERIASLGRDCVDWGDVAGRRRRGDRGRRPARALPRGDQAPRARRVAALVGEARPRTASSRSCSAATTRSRSARSAGWRRPAVPAACSGSTRTAISTAPRPHRAATSTACRSRRRFGVAGPRLRERRAGRRLRSSAPRSSASARSTTGERELIEELDVRVFTMSEIDRLGVERVVREALAFLAGAAFLHVSVDLDAVDPMFAPGVGTPVRGGPLLPRGAPRARARRRVGAARLARARRGEPDPRPRERDRDARRRAGRERARRADPLEPLAALRGRSVSLPGTRRP